MNVVSLHWKKWSNETKIIQTIVITLNKVFVCLYRCGYCVHTWFEIPQAKWMNKILWMLKTICTVLKTYRNADLSK